MHILFLTTYFTPDTAANGFIMDRIAHELVAAGHEITVVTSMPHYDGNRIWPDYRGKLMVRERRPGMEIRHVYLYVPQRKSNLVGRLLNYASFNALSTVAGLLGRRYDLVFAPSPPLTNGVAAHLLSRLRGVPFVYNVQDIYPDVAIDLGVLTNARAIAAFKALERFVYRKAAAVSVISEGFRRNLLRKGVPAEKLHIMPNFMDTAFVRPLPRHNEFSRAQGLDDRYVVLFAGNVGLSQGLEHVLAAAERLRDHPEMLFLIVGNGSGKPELEARAAAMGLDNVRFLPYQPMEQVPEMYAAADLCLVPLRKGISRQSVPSKMYTILCAGKPLVAAVDPGSDTWRFVEANRCGLLIEPEDAGAMADAILQLYRDPAGAAAMGRRGRQRMEADYTPAAVAARYAALFEALAAPEEGGTRSQARQHAPSSR